MESGLYKTEFVSSRGAGRGVVYVRDGKILGGNSNYAFIGSYDERDGVVSVEARGHVAAAEEVHEVRALDLDEDAGSLRGDVGVARAAHDE